VPFEGLLAYLGKELSLARSQPLKVQDEGSSQPLFFQLPFPRGDDRLRANDRNGPTKFLGHEYGHEGLANSGIRLVTGIKSGGLPPVKEINRRALDFVRLLFAHFNTGSMA
tara:strand:+ start:882 stop:1214 length:333 start_codon:yes stop_codon:yes gene_type:complete